MLPGFTFACAMPAQRALLLSIFSGILLTAGWPVNGFPFLLLVAFVPLLQIESARRQLRKKPDPQIYMLALLCFLIWNAGTTWWIYNASGGGAAMAIVANSLLMAGVFYIYHLFNTYVKHYRAFYSLPFFWIGFETLHYEWDIMWPWLTLGNGFATYPSLIQWYEYTGSSGGSLWILCSNLLVHRLLQMKNWGLPTSRHQLMIVLCLLIPILFSMIRFYTYKPAGNPIQVMLLQPNIDPYHEKFNGLSSSEQLDRMLNLAVQKGLNSTDVLIGPETALTKHIWENQLETHSDIIKLKAFQAGYPKTEMLFGASTGKVFMPGERLSSTARKMGEDGLHWDSYNTALFFHAAGKLETYHKSKLVPGVEKMPWPWIFKHIETFAIDLGGISGSLGSQDTVSVFRGKQATIAPIICYESVFPDYVATYVRHGANLLAIITNDGWWGDTPGYRQHLAFGTIRAIETRRDVVRSANTGISAFINQQGVITQKSTWWEPAVLKGEARLNSGQTIFVKLGDYIGNISLVISFCFILLIFAKQISNLRPPRYYGKI